MGWMGLVSGNSSVIVVSLVIECKGRGVTICCVLRLFWFFVCMWIREHTWY